MNEIKETLKRTYGLEASEAMLSGSLQLDPRGILNTDDWAKVKDSLNPKKRMKFTSLAGTDETEPKEQTAQEVIIEQQKGQISRMEKRLEKLTEENDRLKEELESLKPTEDPTALWKAGKITTAQFEQKLKTLKK